jgi:hypothetical protein
MSADQVVIPAGAGEEASTCQSHQVTPTPSSGSNQLVDLLFGNLYLSAASIATAHVEPTFGGCLNDGCAACAVGGGRTSTSRSQTPCGRSSIHRMPPSPAGIWVLLTLPVAKRPEGLTSSGRSQTSSVPNRTTAAHPLDGSLPTLSGHSRRRRQQPLCSGYCRSRSGTQRPVPCKAGFAIWAEQRRPK